MGGMPAIYRRWKEQPETGQWGFDWNAGKASGANEILHLRGRSQSQVPVADTPAKSRIDRWGATRSVVLLV